MVSPFVRLWPEGRSTRAPQGVGLLQAAGGLLPAPPRAACRDALHYTPRLKNVQLKFAEIISVHAAKISRVRMHELP